MPQDFDLTDLIDPTATVEDLDALGQRAAHDGDMLNKDQRLAFKKINDAVQGASPQHLFFIDGPGSTGKSFLYNTLIDYVRGHHRKKVIVVASSGIAALILHGGQTAHSTFKIPIPVHAGETCHIGL